MRRDRLPLALPLKPTHLIACKPGIVELAMEAENPDRDDPESFARAVHDRLWEQQLEVMTDPAILEPFSLEVASTVSCRDPFPTEISSQLERLGYLATQASAGGDRRSWLDKIKGKARSRSHLDQWRRPFARAADIDPALGAFEEQLYEYIPYGPLAETMTEAARALIEAAATTLEVRVEPDAAGLQTLEERLITALGRPRLPVLHPAAVRGLAGFTAAVIRASAHGTRWSDDPQDEAPLWVQAESGTVVRTDPRTRVAAFIAGPQTHLLSEYADQMIRQSLTGAHHA